MSALKCCSRKNVSTTVPCQCKSFFASVKVTWCIHRIRWLRFSDRALVRPLVCYGDVTTFHSCLINLNATGTIPVSTNYSKRSDKMTVTLKPQTALRDNCLGLWLCCHISPCDFPTLNDLSYATEREETSVLPRRTPREPNLSNSTQWPLCLSG